MASFSANLVQHLEHPDEFLCVLGKADPTQNDARMTARGWVVKYGQKLLVWAFGKQLGMLVPRQNVST